MEIPYFEGSDHLIYEEVLINP